MKNLIPFICLLVVGQLAAQDFHPTCDGSRYRTNVFTEVNSTTAIQYGENTTWAGNFQELYLDVFEPANDAVEARPAIILAFGGSYIGGAREDVHFLCESYAQKGFVAVAIDYRIYDGPLFPFPGEDDFKDVVVKSISDMKAAVRFLREDAATDNNFRIDSDFIFVGGISAGAITASHTAMIDSTDVIPDNLLAILEANGGWEGNSSDNFEYSSEVKALVNFSGGLNEAIWIDADDVPFISFHDELDPVVPYGSGSATVFNVPIVEMEGSFSMSQKADEVGLLNILHTIEESGGHVSYFQSPEPGMTEAVITTSATFLHDELLCQGFVNNTADIDAAQYELVATPNPTTGLVSVQSISSSPSNLTLYNAFGQRMAQVQNTNEIDLSTFAKGMYLLEVENAEFAGKIVLKIVRQ